jgi:hypothetical protein
MAQLTRVDQLVFGATGGIVTLPVHSGDTEAVNVFLSW